MKKTKKFRHTRFGTEVLEEALKEIQAIAIKQELEFRYATLVVEHNDSTWSYDTKEEFYVDYRKYELDAVFNFFYYGLDFMVRVNNIYTDVEVDSDNRANIERIFEIFENNKEKYHVPYVEEKEDVIVFIGHGGSSHWRDLKDHLQDKHDIKIEAYETGARSGHAIRDILEDMTKKSTSALLLMTAEDEQSDGEKRARQNVIHEIGLFQGSLGFSRAIVVMEDGVEEFSNISGIQQIRYTNIAETFGEVLATIKREFN